jgi:hypothetical protein
MKEFRARAVINAPAIEVFKILMNLEAYPNFDPNCVKIQGKMIEDGLLKIESKLSPNRIFKVKITELRPHEKMVWESGLPLNLLKGVRTFTVLAKDDQTSDFEMVEVFSGPLVGILGKAIPDMTTAFAEFAKGLKRYLESRAYTKDL